MIPKWSPWSLFRFLPLYLLTKGLWGVHFEPRGVHLLIIAIEMSKAATWYLAPVAASLLSIFKRNINTKITGYVTDTQALLAI